VIRNLDNKDYLLTYKCRYEGTYEFGWFETLEELREFVSDYDINVSQIIHIKDADIIEDNEEVDND
jgi:hypothetical protein